MISSREKSEDLEKQNRLIIQQVSYHKRLNFVQSLFKIKSQDLTYFPGVESYCDYLEREAFLPLMDPTFDSIWALISCTSCTTPKNIAACWDWTLAVLRVIQSEQSEISVHDILQLLEQQGKNSKGSPKRSQNDSY